MARGTRPSLQDHLRRRQEDDFVGRVAQIGDYQQNLGIPPGNKRHRFIFNVFGDAGVSKTSLTERLRQIAVDHGYLAVCVDDQRADDVISAMSVIADEFRKNRARLGEFEKRLATYRKHHHALEPMRAVSAWPAASASVVRCAMVSAAWSGASWPGGLLNAAAILTAGLLLRDRGLSRLPADGNHRRKPALSPAPRHGNRHLPHDTALNAWFFIGVVNATKMVI